MGDSISIGFNKYKNKYSSLIIINEEKLITLSSFTENVICCICCLKVGVVWAASRSFDATKVVSLNLVFSGLLFPLLGVFKSERFLSERASLTEALGLPQCPSRRPFKTREV